MTALDKQFGPYRLVRQIATGGMAEIYLAKTKGIGGFEKFVALKLIHPNFSEDEHFIEMLVDEAKISVQLQHVNIAQIFDLGRVGNTYYITMEFIDGADLFKLLRTVSEADGDFPIDVACYIAKEVCAGLDYAHRRRDPETGQPMGIVHRDVSPQNVLISQAGEVKIVDFGIAKAALRARQTAAGVIKGKYYYMSPEQAWGDPVDHRTDIFSAGILLYEMLAGQMLYLEDNVSRLLDLVRKADIAPPSSKRRGVPKELDDIVMKALRKKAADRYMTAQDFQIALERFIYSTTPNFSTTRIAQFMRQVSGTQQAPVGGLPEARPAAREAPRPEPARPPSRPEPARPIARPEPARPAARPEPRAPEPRAPEPRPRPPNMSTEQRGFFRDIEAAGNQEDTGAFQAGQLARSRSEFVDENSMIFRMAQGRVEPARPGGGRSPGEDTRDVGEDTDAGEGRLTDVGDRLGRPGRKMNDASALAVHGTGSGEFPGEATQITGPPGFSGGFDEGPGRSRTSETAVSEPPQQRRAAGQLDAEPPTLDLPPSSGAGAAGWREPKRPGLPLREGAVSLREGAAALRPVPRYAPAQQSGGAPGDEEPRFSVKRRGKQPEVVTGEVADEEGPTRIDPAKPGAGAGSGTGSAGQGFGAAPGMSPPMPPPSPSLAPPQMHASTPLAQQPTAIQNQPHAGVHVSVPGPPPPPPGAMGGRGMPLPPMPPPQHASPVIPLVPPHLVAAQMQARGQSQQPFDFPFVDPTRPPGSVPLVDLNAPAQRTTSVAPMGALLPQVPADLPGGPGLGNGRPRDAYSAAIPGNAGKFNTYSLEVDEMPKAYKLPRAGGKSRLAIVLAVLGIAGGVALGYIFLRPHPSSTARMELTSQPLGARVTVNGKPQEALTPVNIAGLRRGSSYHIVMELDRYERWDTDQEIGKDQSTVRVVGVMQPITGTLKVSTIPPGASITVNGLAQGAAPLERKIEPAPAPAPFDPRNPLPDLIIEVALDGYKTERHIVQWEGKRTLEVSYPLEVQK